MEQREWTVEGVGRGHHVYMMFRMLISVIASQIIMTSVLFTGCWVSISQKILQCQENRLKFPDPLSLPDGRGLGTRLRFSIDQPRNTRLLIFEIVGSRCVNWRICLALTGDVSTLFINMTVFPGIGTVLGASGRGSRRSPTPSCTEWYNNRL